MAVDLHEVATDWLRLVNFARERGWAADLTGNGFLRFEKNGSVVFGPNLGASLEQLREVARRLIHVEQFGDEHGARWRP
jgi:hypothetical protein